MSLASGGYLRDLFRLLQALLRLSSGKTLPVETRLLELAEHEIRNSYLPIANSDARWLARVQETHRTELEGPEFLADLSRFYDTHLILGYRNGSEWWSVHPLIAEQVKKQAGEFVESR